jgi:hypothetical protein
VVGGFTVELPAVELLDLYNPEDGTVLSITLFETEEDLRKGHATLSSMGPPRSGAVGRRVSVEMYEVPVKINARLAVRTVRPRPSSFHPRAGRIARLI